MRESTKLLKKEMKKDIWMIYSNTPEQNEVYKEKWEHKLRHCETKAQKEYCLNVLMRLKKFR